MGRKLRRLMEKQRKKEENRDKITLSKSDLNEFKKNLTANLCDFNVELLMTCFGLAMRYELKFGSERILRVLRRVDFLMGQVDSGEKTVENLADDLKKETGILIKC